MRQSPLAAGIFYNILGGFFVFLAVQDVNVNGFRFFNYVLILLATFDIGTGLRLMLIHFKVKNSQN
ncbi:YdiK family protein [Domibacillus aminovorans]|nr:MULTISPECIES: YdiK family protein [Bacillaceae]